MSVLFRVRLPLFAVMAAAGDPGPEAPKATVLKVPADSVTVMLPLVVVMLLRVVLPAVKRVKLPPELELLSVVAVVFKLFMFTNWPAALPELAVMLGESTLSAEVLAPMFTPLDKVTEPATTRADGDVP